MSLGAGNEMRRGTVRLGINLIIAAVIVIILSTFFHDALAGWFGFSPDEQARLVYKGFIGGGFCGACGVVVTARGLLSGTDWREDPPVHLVSPLIVLGALVFVFALLFMTSFRDQRSLDLRPGETITI